MGLETFMEQHGVMFDVRRTGQSFQAKGLRNHDRGGEEYIGFYPNTDIRVGDILFNTVTRQEFQVTRVDYHLIHGEVFQVKAYFRSADRREEDGRQPPPVFNYIKIGQASSVQIQQGTVASTQSNSVDVGDRQTLLELAHSLKPKLPLDANSQVEPSPLADVHALLARAQDNRSPLASLIAEALVLAQKLKAEELDRFCRQELAGWATADCKGLPPAYRQVPAFVSTARIFTEHPRWNREDVFDYMRQDPHFIEFPMTVTQPIATVEAMHVPEGDRGILSVTGKARDFLPDTKTPEATIYYYVQPSSYRFLLQCIRSELTQRLLALLPAFSSGEPK